MTDTNRASTPNIGLSGWAGVGTSSLSLLLSVMLERNYYYLGSIFRTVDSFVKSSDQKVLAADFEETYQPIIGRAIDLYGDYVLLNSDNALLESDLACFRVGKSPKLYSFFLVADDEARMERFAKDGRQDIETNFKEREEVLRQEYIKLWDTDIKDEDLIERKYNHIIDNSDMDLESELLIVFRELQENTLFKGAYDWVKLEGNINQTVKDFWREGKQAFRDKLDKKGLLMSPEFMMQEIVREFPEDVQEFPEDIQKLFMGRV